MSLAKKYGATLTVIHVIHDPYGIEGWNLLLPSLERDYQNLLKKSRRQLDDIIADENESGMHIDALIREGEPTLEILAVVKEKKIDLTETLSNGLEALFDHDGIISQQISYLTFHSS